MAAPTQAPAAPTPSSSEFVRGIGPLAAISLVVGSMIGSGIFIVSADISRQVSPWGPGGLLLVWVLTGLITVVGALTYAELAAMMPKAGGQYVFLREGSVAGGRIPLRLDPLRGDPDRHDRGGGRGVREIPQRPRAGHQSGRVPAARPAPAAGGAPTPSSWASRPSASWRSCPFSFSPRSTSAASCSARGSRRSSASPRSARSRPWCCSGSRSSGAPMSRRPTTPPSGARATGVSPSFRSSAPRWWARSSPATPGTTSRSPRPRCRTRAATCPSRWPSAPAS